MQKIITIVFMVILFVAVVYLTREVGECRVNLRDSESGAVVYIENLFDCLGDKDCAAKKMKVGKECIASKE